MPLPLPAAHRILALLARHGPATAEDISHLVGLSRSTVDRSLGVLLSQGLVRRNARGFGRPYLATLTEKGVLAARHVHELDALMVEGSLVTLAEPTTRID